MTISQTSLDQTDPADRAEASTVFKVNLSEYRHVYGDQFYTVVIDKIWQF